ncbi:MAG0490 family ComEA-like DNA-binding protein [Mycoplasma zalophidermidis]|uniref:SLBB domain-containing protein n=1 Tax=Mycoplasma zalophidermidis TaxID=398174 RepID=A0ABS6DRW9_9MOLU|nr:SLBB domain-containing protein [Mycoplasma zalophidermidis]MBU4689952.1 SLBB domain-containing protein [Mycoplasma zalophidermidis]MBU4693758.1 SLBB domain-containing protein [Mycoplasma zalophidermidis]MCR8966763.1 SLBB domain-containing protein [Mycoplasma zalophidermidis]
MRKKRITKYLLGVILLFFGALTISLVNDQRVIKVNESKKKTIIVNVKGAVNNPGEYEIDVGTKFIDILKIAGITNDSDLSKVPIDSHVDKSSTIEIPYKKSTSNKIHWDRLNTVEQLIERGIKGKIALIIINNKNKIGKPTWEKIASLKGIGPASIKKLKTIIIL